MELQKLRVMTTSVEQAEVSPTKHRQSLLRPPLQGEVVNILCNHRCVCNRSCIFIILYHTNLAQFIKQKRAQWPTGINLHHLLQIK